MTIKEHLKFPAYSMEECSLYMLQDMTRNATCNYLNACRVNCKLVDLERINSFRSADIILNNAINDINKTFKTQYLKVDANYKKAGLTAWSFRGVELTELLSQHFDFKFCRKIYSIRTKVKYTEQKFIDAMIYACALLFAKYETVYSFQFEVTCIKVICDYFDCNDIDYSRILDVMNKILLIEFDTILRKINELNMKPAKTPKRQKKSKTQLPSREMFEDWVTCGKYTMTQIKQSIAKQFNVSERTVHRKLVEYGLVRDYHFKDK